jgi:hypothetical protein
VSTPDLWYIRSNTESNADAFYIDIPGTLTAGLCDLAHDHQNSLAMFASKLSHRYLAGRSRAAILGLQDEQSLQRQAAAAPEARFDPAVPGARDPFEGGA